MAKTIDQLRDGWDSQSDGQDRGTWKRSRSSSGCTRIHHPLRKANGMNMIEFAP